MNTNQDQIIGEINSILAILSYCHDASIVAKFEKAPKSASFCAGSIAIYNVGEWNYARLHLNYKPIPSRLYTFYPSATSSHRLGSIAIYGDDVAIECARIKATGTLFGYTVANCSIKQGRRPFVDVQLKM